jgi:hypothetical protein
VTERADLAARANARRESMSVYREVWQILTDYINASIEVVVDRGSLA